MAKKKCFPYESDYEDEYSDEEYAENGGKEGESDENFRLMCNRK